MYQDAKSSYFLFINASSGGGIGNKLLENEKKIEKISFDIEMIRKAQQSKKQIDVYFYNMKTNRNKGLSVLKKLSEEDLCCRAIICGGDGSVMWLVQEMFECGINMEKVPIGVIPLGTGNDFSFFLGWGKTMSELTSKSFHNLKNLIRKWQKSTVEKFDIWDVRAEVFDYGKFQKVQNFENKTLEGQIYERSFCNYFSFGIDGKAGYSFDLHRTSSRYGNLIMYGLMGLLKAMTRTKTIDELIYGMEVLPSNTQPIQEKDERLMEISEIGNKLEATKMEREQATTMIKKKKKTAKKSKLIDEDTLHEGDKQSQMENTVSKILFKTKQKGEKLQKGQQVFLKPDYYNIVALNINSFMGGATDIWKGASNAIENEDSKKFRSMKSGDGLLEFVSFTSSVTIAAEKTIGGFADRIAQGSGPFKFDFRPYDPKQKHRTYLQIDGQFIRFTHPKSLIIQKSRMGSNGQIRILRNNC